MKNRILILFTSLLLVSCWNNKTNTQHTEGAEEDTLNNIENIQFSKSKYNKKSKIFDSEYPKYTIDIQVLHAEGDNDVSQTINKQLVAFLFDNNIMPFEDAMNFYADSIANSFEKELKDLYEPDDEFQETFAYEHTQKGTVSERPLDGIVAYTNRIETYTGGAHGGAMESYINFHTKTGLKITSNEVFGKNQNAVIKLIKEQIVKDNDCKSAAELEEKRGIFSLGDVFISDNNFLLQSDGVLFCFNPYEIAPWSEGFIYVTLSYDQLEGLISTNFKINK